MTFFLLLYPFFTCVNPDPQSSGIRIRIHNTAFTFSQTIYLSIYSLHALEKTDMYILTNIHSSPLEKPTGIYLRQLYLIYGLGKPIVDISPHLCTRTFIHLLYRKSNVSRLVLSVVCPAPHSHSCISLYCQVLFRWQTIWTWKIAHNVRKFRPVRHVKKTGPDLFCFRVWTKNSRLQFRGKWKFFHPQHVAKLCQK